MPKPEIKSIVLPIRMTPELRDKLKKLADKDKRNVSDFIRVTLENLVEKKK